MLNLEYKWIVAESYSYWFTSVNNLSDTIGIGWVFFQTLSQVSFNKQSNPIRPRVNRLMTLND